MKLHTLQNIIEFQDVVYDGVFKNISDGCQYFQGPGLPDICFVYKRFKKAINLSLFNKSTYQDKQSTSSFHFVQGLCPLSSAEISAYFSQIISSQEKETQYKLFSNGEFEIFKITYTMWDFFSQTMVVSQYELSTTSNALSIFKTYGIDAAQEQRIVNITQNQTEGAYVSCVIRAIDKECRLPLAGKFLRNVKLANVKQVNEFLKKYFSVASNLDVKYQSSDQFQSIENTLYQLNWSLSILIKYLERVQLLEVLNDYLQNLKENLILQLIRAILLFKLKKYQQCSEQLALLIVQYPTIYFSKFLQAKAFIKSGDIVKGFLILQNLLPFCSNNVYVWTEIVHIMRIQGNHQFCLLLLNRAAQCSQKEKSLLDNHSQIYLNNFKILCGNSNLSTLGHLESIFEKIQPNIVDQVEAFHQLVQYPNLDSLQIKQRNCDLSTNLRKQDIWFKQQMKTGFRVSDEQFDILMNNKLLDSSLPILKEIIKLHASLTTQKLQNVLNEVFQNTKQTSQIQSNSFTLKFELETQQGNEFDIDTSIHDNLNKSMNIPRLLDEIRYSEEDETIPSFLHDDNEKDEKIKTQVQQNIKSPKRPQSTKSKQASSKSYLKAFRGQKSATNQLNSKKTIQLKSIMQENFESQESERVTPLTSNIHFLAHESQAPSSAIMNKKYIPSVENILMGKSMQSELKRRTDAMCPIFERLISHYIQFISALDLLFVSSTTKQQMKINENKQTFAKSVGQSPSRDFITKSIHKNPSPERQTEVKDFYILPQFSKTDQNFNTIQKQETMFLYKCAYLAYNFQRKEIAKSICGKLNLKGISVQLSSLLINLSSQNNDPRMLIKFLQRSLYDFQDCGVQTVASLPLWMEEHVIRVVRLYGANCLLGMLVNAESDFTFYLIKQVILSVENLQ